MPSECSQSRYIGDIYLHQKSPHKAFHSLDGISAEVGWWLLPGYCFEVRAEWLEERKSEISCMYYNNSMKWNMLQHYNKYQKSRYSLPLWMDPIYCDIFGPPKWIWYIVIYFNLPSERYMACQLDSDISTKEFHLCEQCSLCNRDEKVRCFTIVICSLPLPVADGQAHNHICLHRLEPLLRTNIISFEFLDHLVGR